MRDPAVYRARIVASVAATVISLACGTNYVYSGWAPQFADRLRLSVTQSNLIGTCGNLGMYAVGVPIGIFIDTRGPRPAVLFGAVCLLLGYYPLHMTYDHGPFDDGTGGVSSISLLMMCLYSFLTGMGGCMAFAAAVKTSALNWPHHRGTATAFPLAAFGLSAFFFSLVSHITAPGDPSGFLKLLAVGTFSMTFVGFFLLRVLPHPPAYQAVAPDAGMSLDHSDDEDNQHRPGSGASRVDFGPTRGPPGDEGHANYSADVRGGRRLYGVDAHLPGTSSTGPSAPISNIHYTDDPSSAEATPPTAQYSYQSHQATAVASSAPGAASKADIPASIISSDATVVLNKAPPSSRCDNVDVEAACLHDGEVDETSSLMSRGRTNSDTDSVASSLPGEVLIQNSVDLGQTHRIDIRGIKLLQEAEFWQLFVVLGILSGVGLMTINNIGNDVISLWRSYDPLVDHSFLVTRQQLHVSILSICSFTGRLLSGAGSDLLAKRLHASRLWCLIAASVVFLLAQLCALLVASPHYLSLVSGLSGLAYGFLFGVFPSVVAEAFGIHGLSQNWGLMTLAPVMSGNVFNMFYGTIYDSHSIVEADGSRSCVEGRGCYSAAYKTTLAACLVGLLLTGVVIKHEAKKMMQKRKDDLED